MYFASKYKNWGCFPGFRGMVDFNNVDFYRSGDLLATLLAVNYVRFYLKYLTFLDVLTFQPLDRGSKWLILQIILDGRKYRKYWIYHHWVLVGTLSIQHSVFLAIYSVFSRELILFFLIVFWPQNVSTSSIICRYSEGFLCYAISIFQSSLVKTIVGKNRIFYQAYVYSAVKSNVKSYSPTNHIDAKRWSF